MSNLVDFAESELKLIGMGADTEDDYNKMMHDAIIEIVQKFADQGHSGFSAGYALSILKKLMNYEALTPLTGEDDEWMDVSENNEGELLYQNKRCFHVFKDKDGAYNTEGKIFYRKDDQSDTFTNLASHVRITFPYVPEREYVQVNEESDPE